MRKVFQEALFHVFSYLKYYISTNDLEDETVQYG